jgi:hypothetical protein
MKRQPFLQQLSREHHHALVLAKRALRWAAEQDPSGWDIVRDSHRVDLTPHFRYEETQLLPKLGALHPELVARTLSDHQRLDELARAGSTFAELHELGEPLRAHVRLEERVVFPALEAIAGQLPGP